MFETSDTTGLVAELGGANHDAAWRRFLEVFAPLLLEVARDVERDVDAAGDTFVYICEHLAAAGGARLKRFDAHGAASFATWLRAVAANLALDARRKRQGRFRTLAIVRRMPALEERIYRCRYEQRLSIDETIAALAAEFPAISHDTIVDIDSRLCGSLSSRQHWLLATRRPEVASFEAALNDGESAAVMPADPSPGPEAISSSAESRARLHRALDMLPPEDRLLLDLRYEQGLTLAGVAGVCGLKDSSAADRRIRQVLAALRTTLAQS